jgi:hypothetical protein
LSADKTYPLRGTQARFVSHPRIVLNLQGRISDAEEFARIAEDVSAADEWSRRHCGDQPRS